MVCNQKYGWQVHVVYVYLLAATSRILLPSFCILLNVVYNITFENIWQELAAGRTIDGFTKRHTEDMSNESKLWRRNKGKLVRQLYEECDMCGRPCEVKGSGICNRCIQQEIERKEAGVYCNTLRQAATYCNELEHTATLGHL